MAKPSRAQSRRQAATPRTRAVLLQGGLPPRASMLAVFAIVVVAALVYANSLSGPFVFDDYRAIVGNQTIRSLSIDTVLHPARQTPVAGRPLANLSFALNYAWSGDAVWSYHLVNITIHMLAALALFGVLRRTPVWPPVNADSADHLALFIALAWLVHPLNTDAVNYLTQRTESLAGLFVLVTLYCAIRAHQERGDRWGGAAVLACWCGVATKELVVMAPLLVLLWDWTFAYRSLADALKRRAALYVALASSWLLFAWLSRDTPFFDPGGFETTVSRWTYLMNQAPLIGRYLRLSVLPVGLVLDYGMPRSLALADVWLAGLLVVVLLGLTVAALARKAPWGFWGAWFFMTLAPASSVLPIPSEVGAERRMYLPLIAVLVVLVSGVRWLVGYAKIQWPSRATIPVAITVLVALAAGTVVRNSEYRSGLSIWETVLARYPHARAHENYAIQLRDAGRVDEAIQHLRIAAPDLPDAQHALGSALIERGDVAGGVAQLEAFVRANPRDREIASARAELSSAELRMIAGLLQQQRFEEGETAARRLLAVAPDDATAFNLLGVALASQGRTAEAIEAFRAALRIDPQAREPRNNLDRALSLR